jgi:hypothetical protein
MTIPETVEPSKAMADVESGTKNGKNGAGKGVRTGDKDNEELVLPKNRLVVVFIGLMLTVFLAALDQTIVCMSLLGPSNASDCPADNCCGFEWSGEL